MGRAGNPVAVQENRALFRHLEPGDQVDQGGFAAAGGADHRGELARLHIHAEVQHYILPIPFLSISLADVLEFDMTPAGSMVCGLWILRFRVLVHEVAHVSLWGRG